MAACPDAYLPEMHRGNSNSSSGPDTSNETQSASEMQYSGLQGGVRSLLQVLVEAERCAIRVYTDICNITFGKDHRTYELSLAILNEEIEHEAWFSEFLGEGPSGHFRRGGPGESPYTSRFLTVPNSHNGK